eukprot:GHVU01227727.1.p1 GENE.GHVU01227727.1~~GHVU01227727.1.p1  ORF type:complete len:199 (+),score=32.34 GHVU01227727.1:270-866(+)
MTGFLRDEILLMIFAPVVFFVLDNFDFIPPFLARKGAHMASGYLLLKIASFPLYLRIYIVAFSAAVISYCWLGPGLRFAKPRDPGITVFGIIASGWALLQRPYRLLTPLFFADPIGAIVGKSIRSPKWCGDKTVAGSVAVFVTCVITLGFIPQFGSRVMMAAVLTLAEALGGPLDNLAMAVPLLLYDELLVLRPPLEE